MVDVIRYPHPSPPSSHSLPTPPALAACEFPRLHRELDAMYCDMHGAIIIIPQLVTNRSIKSKQQFNYLKTTTFYYEQSLFCDAIIKAVINAIFNHISKPEYMTSFTRSLQPLP